ncbi:transcription termination/antitermination protein NusA [Candidatus Curtissbacteria bacterium]|nr:transcription termination/antitermination protein NusA [Candidatus Curtissbacteria bacterium]
MAIQARTEFASALNQVCSERGVEPEVVIDSIKQAILAAYRKDYGEPEDIEVNLDANSGEVALTKDGKNVTPGGFGRIAAQTAKQVILQKIREAEKNAILAEYSSKIGTVVSGIVQRISGPIITVNLGKAEAIMPPPEQAHNEKYYVNQRAKFYVVGIKEGTRGEEIIVSRAANGLLEGLFKQEVPEIASNAVEVKTIAREAGSRSKIAVSSSQMGVDPVGSCVGQRGVRVQAVINELGDEKIDVIAYQEDPVEFIKAALSPAKELSVKIDEEEKTAEVTAPDEQLSLAIGKDGQNVRLAAKLTGYRIDIRGKSGSPKEVEAKEKAAQEEAKRVLGVIPEEDVKASGEDKKEKGTQETKPTDQSQVQVQKDNQSRIVPERAEVETVNEESEEKAEAKDGETLKTKSSRQEKKSAKSKKGKEPILTGEDSPESEEITTEPETKPDEPEKGDQDEK